MNKLVAYLTTWEETQACPNQDLRLLTIDDVMANGVLIRLPSRQVVIPSLEGIGTLFVNVCEERAWRNVDFEFWASATSVLCSCENIIGNYVDVQSCVSKRVAELLTSTVRSCHDVYGEFHYFKGRIATSMSKNMSVPNKLVEELDVELGGKYLGWCITSNGDHVHVANLKFAPLLKDIIYMRSIGLI